MAKNYAPQGIFDASSTVEMDVLAVGNITATYPVGYYFNGDGIACAIVCALDNASVRYGVAPANISSGATGKIIVRGLVTVASGGTKGNLITAIGATGAITDASPANTNADIQVLGVSVSATTAYLF